MANDDDILSGPVPDPDAEVTASERAHAKTFAELVDKTLAGRTPPAMSTDDRALLEVATVIRAAHGGLDLAASKKRSIVEDALRQAVGGSAATTSGGLAPIPISRARRWAPWGVASASMAIAAAAIVLLWLRVPVRPSAPSQHQPTATAAAVDSLDALVGPIAREHAADASSRIDIIFADRLDGYREHALAPRRGTKRAP
jgi:hypothetical protein